MSHSFVSSARRTYTIVHTEASLGWGGQERRIFAEAEIMSRRGHRLILVVDPRGQLYQRSRQAEFAVVPQFFGNRYIIPATLALRRLLRRQSVDILNTHSSLDSWVGLWAVKGRRSQTKLIRTRHLSTLIKTSWPTRQLYQSPDAIITTGQAIKDLIVKRAQVPPARIFSIPTGVAVRSLLPPPPGQQGRLSAGLAPE